MYANTVRTARVRVAASRLYDAECALHIAHQSGVDAWIAAASAKLHDAVVEHLAAVAEQSATAQPAPRRLRTARRVVSTGLRPGRRHYSSHRKGRAPHRVR
jgi:hypothetical protein